MWRSRSARNRASACGCGSSLAHPVTFELFGLPIQRFRAIAAAGTGVQIADHGGELGSRRARVHLLVEGQRRGQVAFGHLHACEAGQRVRVMRKREGGAFELPPRLAEPSILQQQIADLGVVPGLPFGIMGAGAVSGHAHALERTGQIARELEGVGDARIRGRARPQGAHAIERGERLLVVAQLEVPVADDAVVPCVARVHGARPPGFGNGVAKPMLRQQHGAEHPLRVVVVRPLGEECAQPRLRPHGGGGVVVDPLDADQRLRQADHRVAVAGVRLQPLLHSRHGGDQVASRRRRDGRHGRRRDGGGPARVAPVGNHNHDGRDHYHGR